MPGNPATKPSDILTYVLAIALAAGCLAFAGYKVFKLGAMENPPVDIGLNFPPPKRKLITDASVLVDPVTTQSVDAAASAPPPGSPVQPYTKEAPVESYRLLTVIDGVAFVELKTFRGTDIVPVSEGARLPGAGRVISIVRHDGRWQLTAGDVSIVSERF